MTKNSGGPGLLIVGGRRLRHVAYVTDDPLFRRFTGLGRLPTARTVSRWLKQFTMTTVGRLQDLNASVIARGVPALGLGTITIDVDGVVVSTGLQVERAFRGFNPHHRKVPSYYPILAHVAETTLYIASFEKCPHAHEALQPFKTTKVGHVEQFFRSHAVALLVDSTNNTTEPVRLS